MARAAKGLWRKKRKGREIGSYRTTIKGEEVNLRTPDPTEALARRRRALKGERNFELADEAAAATVGALDGEPAQGGAAPSEAHTLMVAGSTPAPVASEAPPSGAPPAPESSAATGSNDDPAAAPFSTAAPSGSDANPPAAEGETAAGGEASAWAADVTMAAADAAGPAPAAEEAPAESAEAAAMAELGVTLDDVERLLGLAPRELAGKMIDVQEQAGVAVGQLLKRRARTAEESKPVAMGKMALLLGYAPLIEKAKLGGMVNVHPGWFILAGSLALLGGQLLGAPRITEEGAPGAPPAA